MTTSKNTFTPYRLRHDGARDLRFVGRLLGAAEEGTDTWIRGTYVEVYLTKRGQYVAWRNDWTRWGHVVERCRAKAFPSPEGILGWLGNDRVAKRALEHATEADPRLVAALTEEVA